MRPAISFRWKDQTIMCGPLPKIFILNAGKRIVVRIARAPDLLRVAALRISDKDGPRLQTIAIDRKGVRDIEQPNECDATAVRRPARRRIAIYARRYETQAVRALIVD